MKIVSQNPNSTVVAEYTPSNQSIKEYESEASLEAKLIKILKSNGYEYIAIKCDRDLRANIRTQISNLNNYEFSDNEWKIFLDEYLCNENEGIEEKTTKIQENEIFPLNLDNGNVKNIRILDKNNIHNNTLQVINQYEEVGKYANSF